MTIDDLTLEQLREWIADWLYVNLTAGKWFDDVRDHILWELVQDDVSPEGGDGWYVLRDELLAAYAAKVTP